MLSVAACVLWCVALGYYDGYEPTSIRWPGWKIESSEASSQDKLSYPLTCLFDGDPKTAWVFGREYFKLGPEALNAIRSAWPGDCSIAITPSKPTVLDGLRIMNGYNKSEATFKGNDRVACIQIYDGSKYITTAYPVDKMGWYDVELPKRAYSRLILTFGSRYEGKVHDLCLSEIQLKKNGSPINLKMPHLVLYRGTNNGIDCNCGDDAVLMDLNGKMIENGANEWLEGPKFDPVHRLVAGVSSDLKAPKNPEYAWVYDLMTGKRLLHQMLKKKEHGVMWGQKGSLKIESEDHSIRVVRFKH